MKQNKIYNYHEKPTRYNGIHYRSHLEAVYANLFDRLKIPYQYEAALYWDDLSSRAKGDYSGWIVDFVIYGSTCSVYVEIKHIERLYEESQTITKMETATRKMGKADKNDLMILGYPKPKVGNEIHIGWLGIRQFDKDLSYKWQLAKVGYWRYNNQLNFGFGCEDYDRISGQSWDKRLYQKEAGYLLLAQWENAKSDLRWKSTINREWYRPVL